MSKDFTKKMQIIYYKYSNDLQEATRRVSKRADRLVKRAEKLYHQIRPDFQKENYSNALQNLKDKIKE